MRFLPLGPPASSFVAMEAADLSSEPHELGCVSIEVAVRGMPFDGGMMGLRGNGAYARICRCSLGGRIRGDTGGYKLSQYILHWLFDSV